MASLSQGLLCDKRVIVTSIECIKTVISKLDSEQGDLDGLETVLGQFSPNDVMNNPLTVLDALILYLYMVHAIDWYGSKWVVKAGGHLTVRQEIGVVVCQESKREQEVQAYLQSLKERTQHFLQVLVYSTNFLSPASV